MVLKVFECTECGAKFGPLEESSLVDIVLAHGREAHQIEAPPEYVLDLARPVATAPEDDAGN